MGSAPLHKLGEHDLWIYKVELWTDSGLESSEKMSRNEMIAYLMQLFLDELELDGDTTPLPKMTELHIIREAILESLELGWS